MRCGAACGQSLWMQRSMRMHFLLSVPSLLQTVLLKRQAVIPTMTVMKARVTLSLVVYSRNQSVKNPVMLTEWKTFLSAVPTKSTDANSFDEGLKKLHSI